MNEYWQQLVGLILHLNWGWTKVECRQLGHELKNKAVFRP
jgi:hypothetical protein